MSTLTAALFASAILLTAVIGVAIGYYVGTQPNASGLHGPVAEVIALPFVLLAALGAAVLAVAASRRRDRLTRRARAIAVAPVWLIAGLVVLWLVANVAPHGG
jgi:hypothetical protein